MRLWQILFHRCGDNIEYIDGTRHGLDLNAIPNLKIGEKRQ